MSIKSGYDSLPRGLVDPREMKVGMRLGGEFPNGKRIDLRYFIVDIEYNNKGCRYSGSGCSGRYADDTGGTELFRNDRSAAEFCIPGGSGRYSQRDRSGRCDPDPAW